jgi:hypothetical protein
MVDVLRVDGASVSATRLDPERAHLYVRSMGKLLRVTAICISEADANAHMARHDESAVVAMFGPFILLADKWDKGERVDPDAIAETIAELSDGNRIVISEQPAPRMPSQTERAANATFPGNRTRPGSASRKI